MTTPAQSSAAAIAKWFTDWQHIVLAVVCLVCATVAAVLVPTERWEKLAHYLADPATLVTFTAIGGVFVALYRRARGLPPALVLLLALGASVSGCTDAQWAETLHVVKPIVKWTCGIAGALCGKDDAEACAVLAGVCGLAGPIVDALPEPAVSAEPHDLDAEE